LKQFAKGFSANFKAMSFIKDHNMWGFFIFPVVINIGLFYLGFSVTSGLSDSIFDWLKDFLGIGSWEFDGADTLSSVIWFLIWIVLKILFFFLYAYLGGYIVLILMSPILAWVSERTEKLATGRDYPFSLKRFITDVIRGVFIGVRSFVLEVIITLAIVIIGFIPILGFLSPILLFAVSAYFYGFSFIDYSSERKGLKMKESMSYVSRRKGLAVGTAMPFSALLLIPYIGQMLAGFTAVIGTVGATLAVLEVDGQSRTEISSHA
jgi:CysZ protein